ncbi:chemotaxis protein CheW [Herbaspirillum sp. RTI4]|uniref:chemotaxis protein CheW n=1 Tax=Herbaspirillum sp. RTI4 TaxID=3048640 RepID=UPI002AB44E38|nr:chemotaxis protein CheW [Herbaspirillum sp. RTI4]MDY7578088.1 chemotaxis protein CheW [Herbaspirillum sp. RTI4]MEA9980677.1 chemotaxis protein CheW [Herbaspirillum sp. RTI4]
MMTSTTTQLSHGRSAADGDDEEGREDAKQYLTFSLGKEVFALEISSIKEILRNVQLATVPLMPAHMRGVINLRGAVVPVIDLAVLFGRDALEVSKRTSVIVLEITDAGDVLDIGIMVDAVSAVIEIGAELIEPAPGFGTPVRAEFIDGLGKLEDGFVIILNAERTFSLHQMAPEQTETP